MNDFKDITLLEVYRGDTFVGNLRRTTLGCNLEFDKTFIENQIYSELGFCIPKQENVQYSGVNLPPYFAGLLPEGLRLKALISELKTSEDDLFTLLAAVGDNAVGDIYTKSPITKTSKYKPEIPLSRDIDFYDFFYQSLESSMLSKNSDSLAGVQEKISASMINLPVRTAKKNKSYILKLNPKDKPNLVQNEYYSLQLAKKCGIKVNNAKIIYDKNNNPALLVERFDRVIDANKKVKLVHQEDACQFLNRYPADKYRLSFQEICIAIDKFTTAPVIELLKALQLYIFSYLIGNGDLHAKNISLQIDPSTRRIQLTPAYDLICTYIYKDHKMALKLDGRDTNFRRQHFIDFGVRLNLTNKAIEQMIDKLIFNLNKNNEVLLNIPNLTSKDKNLIKKMQQDRMKELT